MDDFYSAPHHFRADMDDVKQDKWTEAKLLPTCCRIESH